MQRNRRDFLADVGKGLAIAGLGSSLAADLGLSPTWAGETPKELTFGDLEPLVRLIQDTPADKILPIAVNKLNNGLELKTLVAAAALANVRTFGGEDYIGFHTMMALGPALEMARELPTPQQALPVLKVLYRNCNRIAEKGGHKDEVLKPVESAKIPTDKPTSELIREHIRAKNTKAAESVIAAQSADDAFNDLLPTVGEAPEVHRIVMVWRSWELLDVLGKEHAQTMLRQSVHYCVNSEGRQYMTRYTPIQTLVPKLLDEHKLMKRGFGKKTGDAAWVQELRANIFKSSAAGAAGAVAAAIAEGFSREAIAEAIRLAANDLVLRDRGRPKNQTSANKPEGSIHGDSIGVHASDSANAWCNLARTANTRNSLVALILGAYQVAMDRVDRGGDFLKWDEYGDPMASLKVGTKDQARILQMAESAIKNKDQFAVAAAIARYGAEGHPAGPAFDLLLKYSISEDGALHAEKYYRTVQEAYQLSQPVYRWKHVISLARVVASSYGQPAPGVDEAKKLLKA